LATREREYKGEVCARIREGRWKGMNNYEEKNLIFALSVRKNIPLYKI